MFSPEASAVTVNEQGGRQSRLPGAFCHLPATAIRWLRRCHITKSLSKDGHFEAALDHILELLADNQGGSDCLGVAFAHLAFAVECESHVDTVQVCSDDFFPYDALRRIAAVMQVGAARNGRGNWRKIEYFSHIDHAIYHMFSYGAGDESEDHLGHALTRLAMAIEVEDIDYRFTGIDEPELPPVGKPFNISVGIDVDIRPVERVIDSLREMSERYFNHRECVTAAIRASLAQGDMAFLGDLTDGEWKAFTAGPVMHEFATRDDEGMGRAMHSVYTAGDVAHSLGAGAYIGEPLENDALD